MIKYSKKGFSLLDVMFAVGIALVGLLGIVGLLRYVILVGRASSDRFIATNLAEEGIEIVRSYRDSNWKEYMSLYSIDNTTFPISTPTNYLVDYRQNSLLNYSDTFLYIDTNDFYSYNTTGGTPTKFKRKIILDPTLSCTGIGTDQGQCIKVISEVTWDKYTLDVEDWLYNWKP